MPPLPDVFESCACQEGAGTTIGRWVSLLEDKWKPDLQALPAELDGPTGSPESGGPSLGASGALTLEDRTQSSLPPKCTAAVVT